MAANKGSSPLPFDDKFDACMTEIPDAGIAIDLEKVTELVRSEPQAANTFIQRQCRLAASQPRYLQSALVVAEAYRTLFADDSLVKQVTSRATALFAEEVLDEFIHLSSPELSRPEPPEREQARQWWHRQPGGFRAICDQCREPLPRGDGYAVAGREVNFGASRIDLGEELLCRRCFNHWTRLGKRKRHGCERDDPDIR
jgi:hypothetical protein